jgi:signal transduction histidine kinase
MPTPADRFSRGLLWVRLAVGPAVIAYIAADDNEYPSGYRAAAYTVVGLYMAAAIVAAFVGSRRLARPQRVRFDAAMLLCDFGVLAALELILDFEQSQPLRTLFFIPILEGALRFGMVGGLTVGLATLGVLTIAELRDAGPDDAPFAARSLFFRGGVGILLGVLVGRLADDLRTQLVRGASRALEAERLRDELGRRVDVLEAANRCARALGSSLDVEQAFGAFIRELRGLVPFDRTAIVLAEEGSAQVMATAGLGADTIFPPGTAAPVAGTVLEEVLRGQPVVRADILESQYREETALAELGLRAELAVPLLLGPRAIGMLAVVRSEPDSFTAEEVELVTLLGRLVATAVQNIRAYEAERSTVDELRRLSTLRADFVSLVSHELRSPMAAVIGAARTLQERWRELSPDQRESFLALIGDETSRLASLIADVLDTSRIEAGTFSYSFSDVDVGVLVRDVAAAAEIGQDEVGVEATVREPVPLVRGDGDRLRQVITNLVENAVKYSPAGDRVRLNVYAQNGRVLVDVADSGPGIPLDQQRLIFEKFGRARTTGGSGKPGTGLGLFIARSIAEVHGGTLEVRSAPERGTTFTLALPAAG